MLEAAHAGVPPDRGDGRPAGRASAARTPTRPPIRSGIFGRLVPTVDVTDGTYPELGTRLGGPGAPIGTPAFHLNVCFEDPLTPNDRWRPHLQVGGDLGDSPEILPSSSIPLGQRTVVVAGDDAGPRARQLAERANWPLLAEPTSGSRTGTHALRTYRLLLGTGLADHIERAVVFGHPTLSRPVSRLLARDDVEVWARPSGLWGALPAGADHDFVHLHVDESDDTTWLDRWRDADARVGRDLDALLAAEPEPHGVRRRRGGGAGPSARRAARRRRLQPDPRPRPDGAAATRSARAAR